MVTALLSLAVYLVLAVVLGSVVGRRLQRDFG
jgi:hypothetical protein